MQAQFLRGLLITLLLLIAAPSGVITAMPAATNAIYLPLIQIPVINVSLTPIGTPTWRPVDFHVFSAPVGTASDGYAEFYATNCALLPSPTHLCGQAGTPHPPPYDTEFALGVAKQRFRDGQRFSVAEFSNGNGVYVVWMMIPDPGTTGSSHDFAAGPIFPPTVFPIHLEAPVYQNGTVYDQAPYVTDMQPEDATVDGPSHFPLFLAINTDFGPSGANPIGNYEYRITMVDRQGNGWLITARFTIT